MKTITRRNTNKNDKEEVIQILTQKEMLLIK